MSLWCTIWKGPYWAEVSTEHNETHTPRGNKYFIVSVEKGFLKASLFSLFIAYLNYCIRILSGQIGIKAWGLIKTAIDVQVEGVFFSTGWKESL